MPDPTLERIAREFERIGLLMQHDAELPSFTMLAAGEPVRGSWWADPRCHQIYDLMQEFDHHVPVLNAKVVNGKVTYVHRRLWPALLTVVQNPAPERVQRLSRTAQRLRERVHEESPVRADALRKARFAAPAELTKAIRELELKLLVHTDEVHTESGAHAKVLQTWASWAAEQNVQAGRDLAAARAELGRAVEALCDGSTRKPKLPW